MLPSLSVLSAVNDHNDNNDPLKYDVAIFSLDSPHKLSKKSDENHKKPKHLYEIEI